MKRVLISALYLLGVVFQVMADDRETVGNLLKERTEAVLGILQTNDVDEQMKKSQIMDIIGPIIDFRLIAKLTLGKAIWSNLNDKQQNEFIDLFAKRLGKLFLDKSIMYFCGDISFKPAIAHGNKVYIPVEVETKDTPFEMLYKFYSSDEGWMTYDVEINGVSLIKSYQAQFSEILKSGNAEDLLTSLKKPVEE